MADESVQGEESLPLASGNGEDEQTSTEGEKEEEIIGEVKEGEQAGTQHKPDWEAPSQEELANEEELIRAEAGGSTIPQPEHALGRLGVLMRGKDSVLSTEYLDAIERDATFAAQNLAMLMSALMANMHAVSRIFVLLPQNSPKPKKKNKITGLSSQGMGALKLSVDNTSDCVAEAVLQMHDFLTKCKQLDEDMKPLVALAAQMYTGPADNFG